MSVTTTARPQKLVRETFTLWRINEVKSRAGVPYMPVECDSLEDAVQRGTDPLNHKRQFIVRRVDMMTGQVTLHIYTVKQKSKPTYRYHNFETRAVRDFYAEHVQDIVLTPEFLAYEKEAEQ